MSAHELETILSAAMILGSVVGAVVGLAVLSRDGRER
jgi:hypothetical protein